MQPACTPRLLLARWGGAARRSAGRSAGGATGDDHGDTRRNDSAPHIHTERRPGAPHQPPGGRGPVTATAVGAPGHRPAYDWITPTEAATRLGIPVREVYRLIDRGEVPGYRLAEEIRLLAHEVDELARRRPPR